VFEKKEIKEEECQSLQSLTKKVDLDELAKRGGARLQELGFQLGELVDPKVSMPPERCGDTSAAQYSHESHQVLAASCTTPTPR